jgi:hypothetical protein
MYNTNMSSSNIIKSKDKFNLKGKFRVITTDSITGKVIATTPFYHNLVMDGTDTGFNLILKRLIADNTYSLNITHLDIGTNATTPALSDTTALSGVVARAALATATISGSSATFRFFFADAELANGTYQDVRMVVDGAASLGTGQLFNRALFGSPYTKGANQNTTIEFLVSKT